VSRPQNTDFFGIGNALQGAAGIYFQTCRRTGRTTHLVEALKDGDRVVCASGPEAHRLGILARERGVEVQCVVVDPQNVHQLYEMGTAQGRLLFDHTWLERHYLLALDEAGWRISELQGRLSGYDVRHRETRRAAEALTRHPYWGPGYDTPPDLKGNP